MITYERSIGIDNANSRVRQQTRSEAAANAELMGERIRVSVSPETSSLAPGGHAEVTLDVISKRDIVDEFPLAMEGVDPASVAVHAPTLALPPDAEAGRASSLMANPGASRRCLRRVHREFTGLPALPE